MNDLVGAALHVCGGHLWYAEVSRDPEGLSLGTIGHRVVKADVGQAFVGAVTGTDVSREGWEGLEEAVATLSEGQGRIVVSPSAAYSFFVPLPKECSPRDRRQQVLQQTAVVTGVGTVADLHVRTSVVREASEQAGRPHEWCHVLAFPEAARGRLREEIGLTEDDWTWMVSTEAVARAPRCEKEAAGALLVGTYDEHTEFSLLRSGEWHHAQYTDATEPPADVAYAARSFLNDVGVSPETVERLLGYGPRHDPALASALETELGQALDRLDPFAGRIEGEAPEPSERPAFGPCIGAALQALDD